MLLCCSWCCCVPAGQYRPRCQSTCSVASGQRARQTGAKLEAAVVCLQHSSSSSSSCVDQLGSAWSVAMAPRAGQTGAEVEAAMQCVCARSSRNSRSRNSNSNSSYTVGVLGFLASGQRARSTSAQVEASVQGGCVLAAAAQVAAVAEVECLVRRNSSNFQPARDCARGDGNCFSRACSLASGRRAMRIGCKAATTVM